MLNRRLEVLIRMKVNIPIYMIPFKSKSPVTQEIRNLRWRTYAICNSVSKFNSISSKIIDNLKSSFVYPIAMKRPKKKKKILLSALFGALTFYTIKSNSRFQSGG